MDNVSKYATPGLVIVNSQSLFPESRSVTLDPPGSTTTVELRVYKKGPGKAHNFPTHDPRNSVWKIYTLEVTREPPPPTTPTCTT